MDQSNLSTLAAHAVPSAVGSLAFAAPPRHLACRLTGVASWAVRSTSQGQSRAEWPVWQIQLLVHKAFIAKPILDPKEV